MIFKYIFKNIIRMKARTLLLIFIITGVVGILIFTSMFKQYTDNLIKQNQTKLLKYHKVIPIHKPGYLYSNPFFSVDMIEKVCSSFPVIKDTVIISAAPCFGDIMAVKPDNYIESPDKIPFVLNGIVDTQTTESWHNGERYLIKGRVLTKKDYDKKNRAVLIDSKVAAVNGLEIGDKITLKLPDKEINLNYQTVEKTTIEYEIVGIFNTSETITGVEKFPNEVSYNNIFVPLTTMPESFDKIVTELYLKFNSEKSAREFESFILANKTYMGMYNLLSSSDIRIVSQKGLYMQKIAPIIDANNIVTFLTYIFSVIGIILIPAIVFILYSQRKKEAAILTAVGMNKSLIATLFTGEILAIIIITSLIFGFILLPPAAVVSEKIYKELVEDNAVHNLQNTSLTTYFEEEAKSINKNDDLTTDIISQSFIFVFLTMCVTAFLSAGVSLYAILKNEPMIILAKT